MRWLVAAVFFAYELFLFGAAVYVVVRAVDLWVWNRRHRPRHGRDS